jgi:hypothetical protein
MIADNPFLNIISPLNTFHGYDADSFIELLFNFQINAKGLSVSVVTGNKTGA